MSDHGSPKIAADSWGPLSPAAFHEFLASAPGEVGERLSELSVIVDQWLPWAQEHLMALSELAGYDTSLSGQALVFPWYLALSSHYMLHDAAIDEPKTDVASILASNDAQTLANWYFEDRLLPSMAPSRRPDATEAMARRFAERNGALQAELPRKTGWAQVSEEDRLSAIGRNNSTLMTYEVLCSLAGTTVSAQVVECIGQLVYLMQLGDDLGDWVDDYLSENHTAFLRGCRTQCGTGAFRSQSALATAIFTSGYYERYVAKLIVDFDQLRGAFESSSALDTTHAIAYVDAAREKAANLLLAVVKTKLTHVGQ